MGKEPPVRITGDVMREMEDKHPRARDDDVLRLANLRDVSASAAAQISVDDVERAIRSFARGSGSGPFALRPEHLKAALVPGLKDELLRQISSVMNIMAQGRAPSSLQPLICGASLAALPKPDGSHRPVACGITWRRLCGKCLWYGVKDMALDHLFPMQVGVNVSGGAEAVVHVTRQWLSRWKDDRSRVLVTIDIENAYNTLDRSAILSSVRRVAPSLSFRG